MEPHKPATPIDAALARLPEWTPPPGFAARVAALASARAEVRLSAGWLQLLPRAITVMACAAVAAWLGGELIQAGLLSLSVQDQATLTWTFAAGSLGLAWHCVRQRRPFRV